MARQTSHHSKYGFERKPPGGGRGRVTAFWSVVGIVLVAAVLSVTLDASMRLSRPSPTMTDLAPPQPMAFIPLTGEVDFNDRFSAEKRSAKSEELPAQF